MLITPALLLAATLLALYAVKRHCDNQPDPSQDEHITRNTGDMFITNPNALQFLDETRPVSRTCPLSQPPYGAI